MEWLGDAWRWLMAQYVDWELVLRFIEVLIWPIITLMGFVMIRPWRVVDAVLENGGELGLGPANLRLAKRVDEIAASVESDETTAPDASETPAVTNPLQGAADPYTTVLNGWGKVAEGLEEAVRRAKLPPLDRRNPMDTVTRLRRQQVIGSRLERNIREMWDFRNKVKHAGSRRLERLGLTQLGADDFYAACVKVRRGILNALSYREAKGTLTTAAPPALSEPTQPSAPLN
jgi:hypothetical protein